jgi:hypothetical protein
MNLINIIFKKKTKAQKCQCDYYKSSAKFSHTFKILQILKVFLGISLMHRLLIVDN